MKRYYLHILFVTSILFFKISILSGNPVVERFLNITTEDGLSHNTVNSIVKDKEGFIWIATEDGLNRFDGYDIDQFHYQPEDSTGIAFKAISNLFRDSNDDIWVLTKNDHLQKLDEEELTFSTVFNGNYLNQHYKLNYITEDDQKKLWLVTHENGIITYHLENKNIERLRISSGFNFNRITAIFRSDDQIWFSNDQGQVGIYKFNNHVFTSIDLSRYFQTASNNISTIYFNWEYIYLGTINNGLYIFNHKFELVKHLQRGLEGIALTSNIISDIKEDKTGRVWVSSAIRGINIISASATKALVRKLE